MKKLIILIGAIMIALMLLNFQCNDNIVDPPTGHPPGYQEDIPWPSLADSPWPMNHHDPQSTGRSKYAGPELGQIDWKLDSIYMKSGVSIGCDRTIYFISIDKKGLFAVKPDGHIKWVLQEVVDNSYAVTTPLISADGTLYIGGGIGGKLYAINPVGVIKWTLNTLGVLWQVGLNIGKDGTIFLLNGGESIVSKLVAVNPSGSIEWYYENQTINYDENIGTAFSPDGKTIYVPGTGPSILAVDVDSRLLNWSFGESTLRCSPTVDSDGNIYFLSKNDSINFGDFSIYCLKPDGSIKWTYDLGFTGSDNFYYLEGTLDKEGNYSFALDTLYSFDFWGNLRWKLELNDISGSSLVNDKDGNIYLNVGAFSKYYAVSKNGNILWIVDLENQFSGFSPAISADKKLIIPTWKSNFLFSIK